MNALHKIINKVYEEYKDQGVTREDVVDIVNAQFGFVVKVMKAGKLERIRLMYLGTFLVTEQRKAFLKKRRDAKNRDSNESAEEKSGLSNGEHKNNPPEE
jgi:nucleoid DNA-binding protein